jgi:glutamine amidotransferase
MAIITIIDYGMGNLGSIANMLKKIGVESVITSDLKIIERSEKLILPGVGSFAKAMENINNLQMTSAIKQLVQNNTPLLGICLGMQLLASHSEEGNVEGLNIIPGNVKRFIPLDNLKIPHMGWNMVKYKTDNILFKGFEEFEEPRFYFVHSYYYQCDKLENVAATSFYGEEFTCSVKNGNAYGVQFHPEKSHKFGMKLLENFSQI